MGGFCCHVLRLFSSLYIRSFLYANDVLLEVSTVYCQQWTDSGLSNYQIVRQYTV